MPDPPRLSLKRDTTLLGARLNNTSKRASESWPKLSDLCRSEVLRVPSTSLHNLIGLRSKEASGGFGTARIGVIKPGNKDCWFTFRIELPVNKTLREEHASVVRERSVDLWKRPDDWRSRTDHVSETVIVLENQSAN